MQTETLHVNEVHNNTGSMTLSGLNQEAESGNIGVVVERQKHKHEDWRSGARKRRETR